MNKALLDTDTYSEILKAINPNIAQNAATYRQAHGVLSVSAITVMEIVYGFQRVQNPHRLQDFLTAVAVEEVLDFERNAAELAGRIAGVRSFKHFECVVDRLPSRRQACFSVKEIPLHFPLL